MLRLIISALFILAGVKVIVTALIGNFRYSYVLNRMQVGATADSVKLLVMIIFFWVASPVCSHYLARTEVIANEKILEEVEVVRHDNI